MASIAKTEHRREADDKLSPPLESACLSDSLHDRLAMTEDGLQPKTPQLPEKRMVMLSEGLQPQRHGGGAVKVGWIWLSQFYWDALFLRVNCCSQRFYLSVMRSQKYPNTKHKTD